jgi:2-alkyl-3-oxoalkanoate reductase
MPNKKTYKKFPRIAFVGCGNVANVHMHFLLKMGAKVASVCDSSETRAMVFAEKFNVKTYHTKVEKMLEIEKPDVLHILTPPHTHFALALKGLEAGCHLIIEKPLCLNTSDAVAIFEKAKEKKLRVYVDHTRIYHPMIRKAQQVLKTGKYGQIIRLEYDYDDPGLETVDGKRVFAKNVPSWVKSLKGGVFTDLLPHPISVFLSFDDDLEIEDVRPTLNEEGIIEEFDIRFATKMVSATVKLSLNVKPLRNVLHIYCKNGSIKIDFRNFYSVFLLDKNLPNIIGRCYYTINTSFQMAFGFFKSVTGILRGTFHPYSGLDEFLKIFYSELQSERNGLEKSAKVIKGISLLEKILSDIEVGEYPNAKKTNEGRVLQEERIAIGAEYLVTGGTGFIGKALVERLVQEGKRVRVLCRRNSRIEELPANIEVCIGDVRDISSLNIAVKGIKIVYHCAAAMNGDWAEFYESTVLGTKNLIKVIRENDVVKVIYVSSLSVLNYNKLRNNGRVDENAFLEKYPKRRGFYTQAKKQAEDIVREFAKENPYKKTIVMRPGLVYGKGSNKVLGNVGILIGKYLFVFGLGKRLMGLNYVENLVEALIVASRVKAPKSMIYHVTDPDQPTVTEYIRIYNALVNDPIVPIYIPITIWRIGFYLVDLIVLLKSGKKGNFSYKFASNSKKLDYSSDRLVSEFEWYPKWKFISCMEKVYGQKEGKTTS